MGNFLQVLDELQIVLGLIQQLCNRTDVPINPSKMVVISFTKKRALEGLNESTPFGENIQLIKLPQDESFILKIISLIHIHYTYENMKRASYDKLMLTFTKIRIM
jgi:hypothetical protein